MRKTRQQMLDGEVVKGCEHCYDLEDMGFVTEQTMTEIGLNTVIEVKKLFQRIEQSKRNGYRVEEPMYLDFRLGNMCNRSVECALPKTVHK